MAFHAQSYFGTKTAHISKITTITRCPQLTISRKLNLISTINGHLVTIEVMLFKDANRIPLNISIGG